MCSAKLFWFGVEEPDVWHTEIQVVGHSFVHSGHSIFRREDLDTEEGGNAKNLARRFAQSDAHIGDSKTRLGYLHPLLDNRRNALFLAAVVKVGKYRALQTPLVVFS